MTGYDSPEQDHRDPDALPRWRSAIGMKAFDLAWEAAKAGLIVTQMTASCRAVPGECFNIQMWTPDGKIWAEGTHEHPDQIRGHIDHWRTTKAQEDTYPLSLLTGYKLIPTGSGKGVMAMCDRHDGEVSALVVNSLTEAPTMADLAFMAGEHEAEHHGGPAMPDDIADA